MEDIQKRIKEVHMFFSNDDIHLGFRRLLDCAMDTQNMNIYKEAIALTDWKEGNTFEQQELNQKVTSLLDKIEKLTVKQNNRTVPILVVNKVVKSYKKRNFALGEISLSIKKGEIFGLVGENGNGKTTLLRILAKELHHNKGTISYNFDNEISSDYDLRTKLVYIPQRTERWYGSLLDNLKFVVSNYGVPSEEIEPRVLLMIARFGLWNYKELKWDELSSGYKMRFELARTMLRKPEILLLDEPLANLDVLAQQVVLEDLKSIGNSINNPLAIILSSQQLYEVEKISDKIVFLKNGKQNDEFLEKTKELIIEIETQATKNELTICFKKLPLKKLIYNGGVYFAYFNEQTQFNQVMTSLVEYETEIIYIRNISQSTRRFFVS